MSSSLVAEPIEEGSLEREAGVLLAEALALRSVCHRSGVRDRYRGLLEQTIERAESVLARAGGRAGESSVLRGVSWILVQAHAARAEDARYGAGQLARGSQRAPTVLDCEDGWQRVEEIVLGAEASASAALRAAGVLDEERGWKLARAAQTSAQKARQILDERNHAYTFHADPSFSFGEGWYLAAAAALTGAPVQLEPEKAQTAQSELFLREAGLGSTLVPYRSRPRANKALPEIVARAFRADPSAAQAKLRAAFLGREPVSRAIQEWALERLAGVSMKKKILLWVRSGTHHPHRNTDYSELAALCHMASAEDLIPIVVGDALRGGPIPERAVDMTLFWKEPLFQEGNMRRAQLQLFEQLKRDHGLRGQIGVTTAGMDGPALMGLPTLYLTEEANVRLGSWVGAIPGYAEIVRGSGYLEQIAHTMRIWRDRAQLG